MCPLSRWCVWLADRPGIEPGDLPESVSDSSRSSVARRMTLEPRPFPSRPFLMCRRADSADPPCVPFTRLGCLLASARWLSPCRFRAHYLGPLDSSVTRRMPLTHPTITRPRHPCSTVMALHVGVLALSSRISLPREGNVRDGIAAMIPREGHPITPQSFGPVRAVSSVTRERSKLSAIPHDGGCKPWRPARFANGQTSPLIWVGSVEPDREHS